MSVTIKFQEKTILVDWQNAIENFECFLSLLEVFGTNDTEYEATEEEFLFCEYVFANKYQQTNLNLVWAAEKLGYKNIQKFYKDAHRLYTDMSTFVDHGLSLHGPTPDFQKKLVSLETQPMLLLIVKYSLHKDPVFVNHLHFDWPHFGYRDNFVNDYLSAVWGARPGNLSEVLPDGGEPYYNRWIIQQVLFYLVQNCYPDPATQPILLDLTMQLKFYLSK